MINLDLIYLNFFLVEGSKQFEVLIRHKSLFKTVRYDLYFPIKMNGHHHQRFSIFCLNLKQTKNVGVKLKTAVGYAFRFSDYAIPKKYIQFNEMHWTLGTHLAIISTTLKKNHSKPHNCSFSFRTQRQHKWKINRM